MNSLLEAMEREGWNELKSKKQDKQEEELKKYENINPNILTPVEFETIMDLPAKFMNLTLRQLVLEYHHPQGMQAHAKTLDTIMSAMKKSVDIKKAQDELIDRDFVIAHVFTYLNVLSEVIFDYCGTDKKMLKDFTKMIEETQRHIDDELEKLQKIQELVAG